MTAPDFAALGLRPYVAPSPDATVADAVRAYAASPAHQRLAASTQRTYRHALRRLVAVFGSVRLRDWQASWGAHYLDALAETPALANRDCRVLSTVFGWAARAGHVQRNPIRDLRLHPEPPRTELPDVEALRRFAATCHPRLRGFISLKLATGARRGQLVALRWRHWRDGELHVAGAKGGRATIYIGPAVAEALASCAAACHGVAPERCGDDLPVVGTARGRPYRDGASWWRANWQPAMAEWCEAGGQRMREHDLRAVVASSGDVATAQLRLGHVTSAVTQRVYRRGARRVESADLFETMGGPAVFPSRALHGARGLKRDEPRDRHGPSADERMFPAQAGLSAAGSPAPTDAPAGTADHSRPTGAAGGSAKPPMRGQRKGPQRIAEASAGGGP